MEKEILKEIERLREEMVKKGLELGMTHPLVLELSRKLDSLHNELEKIKKRKKYKQKESNKDHHLYEESLQYA